MHHIVPLSEIRKGYLVDPINDLRPVCPNCHSMLHRQRPPYTIEQLKGMIRE
nr:HNH endonuclease [Geoalkalibacter halelectricus]